MDRHYDSSEGEFVDFETLADWEERDKAKNARIAHLEAQVAAADALAREVERIATHKQKEMGLDYGRPHHPAYPELFRRLAVYEAKKGGA